MLQRRFGVERERLLKLRETIQHQLDAGWLPDFLAETEAIRNRDWHIAPIPQDLQNRCVEITEPTDRKMIINALNSGANVFMADFEDANSPTWDNMVSGQINLCDAVNRTIEFSDPKTGRGYELNEFEEFLTLPAYRHLVSFWNCLQAIPHWLQQAISSHFGF